MEITPPRERVLENEEKMAAWLKNTGIVGHLFIESYGLLIVRNWIDTTEGGTQPSALKVSIAVPAAYLGTEKPFILHTTGLTEAQKSIQLGKIHIKEAGFFFEPTQELVEALEPKKATASKEVSSTSEESESDDNEIPDMSDIDQSEVAKLEKIMSFCEE